MLPWIAYTPQADRGTCELFEEIERYLSDANLAGPMRELIALLEECLNTDLGPQLYKDVPSLCHEAVAGTGIFEFIKKPLRLYWFYGKDRKVIIIPKITHKKTRATPKEIVKTLKSCKSDYENAYKNNTIVLLN